MTKQLVVRLKKKDGNVDTHCYSENKSRPGSTLMNANKSSGSFKLNKTQSAKKKEKSPNNTMSAKELKDMSKVLKNHERCAKSVI